MNKKKKEEKVIIPGGVKLSNYLQNYEVAKPLFDKIRTDRKKLFISIFISGCGIILFIIGFFSELPKFIGVVILFIGYLPLRHFDKSIDQNIKKAKELDLLKD